MIYRQIRVDDAPQDALESVVQRPSQGFAAGARFFPEPLVDEHVQVDRNSDREDDPGNSGQRQRGAGDGQDGDDQHDVDDDGNDGHDTEEAVEADHTGCYGNGRDQARREAVCNGVGPVLGTDGALLDDGQRNGKRAGPHQGGKIVRPVLREISGNPDGIAGKRAIQNGRRDNLSVEHDRELLPWIRLQEWRDPRGSPGCNPCIDDRFARCRIEARLCLDEVRRRSKGASLDEVGYRRIVQRIEDLGPRRRPRIDGLLCWHRGIQPLQGDISSLPEEILQSLRLVQTGDLHAQPVTAATLYDRHDRDDFADTPAYDLDGLGDGI